MHLTGALSVDPLLGLLSVTMGRLGRGVKVLRLVTLGKSNSEIAEELVISLNTVACPVSRILNKTNPAIPTFDTSSRLSHAQLDCLARKLGKTPSPSTWR